ncbi:bile salt sulfotransferase-like [Choloepus didactylus]|uniref:bile salt sulfotransferase-like n=1 Tax=Choloepus didactylus TaxID=27675 RepID=UPI00189DAD52|nr:bile salt sulfotransferase-like [Choloepus didactylus]
MSVLRSGGPGSFTEQEDRVKMSQQLYLFEGIKMNPLFTSKEDLHRARDEFLVRDDDVIILTYPRSGTHWMIEILSLITSKGDPSWVQSVPSFLRSPWIENGTMMKALEEQDGPRLMTSHLPIHLFPKSYFTSNAKVIYVVRNPRDVLTSLYYLAKENKLWKQDSFDEYFNRFIQGDVIYGLWFDHILGWMERSDKKSFLVVFYEELQRDIRGSVEKICQFLGKNLEPEELDSVLHNSSFSVMKENKMVNSSLINQGFSAYTKAPILRQGISEDWKNHFTVAQSEAFDKLFREKLSHLGPRLFPWP